MPGTAGPNLGLYSGYSPHDDGWGVESYNPAMELLDAMFDAVVIAIGTAPPGSPAAGDRYIIDASATGDWSGHDGAFTVYRDGDWVFYSPKDGWRVFNIATSKYLRFEDPNWVDDTPSIASLPDVVISGTLTNGESLVFDSGTSKFTNITVSAGGATDLDGLSDVAITTSSLADGQTLVFNSATNLFENSTVSGGGATDLDGLSDVTITTSSLANGQTLVYNSTTSQFENLTVSGGGATTLDDLTDVVITSAGIQDILANDGSDFINLRQHYGVAFSAPQTIAYTANQVIGHHAFSAGVTIPANFGSYNGRTSKAGGTVNATGSTVISVEKASSGTPNTFSQIGTITIGASGVAATFATTSGTAKTFSAGDIMRLVMPATPDTTFAGFYCTIVGRET